MQATGDHSEPGSDLESGAPVTEATPPEPPTPPWHRHPVVRTGTLILSVLAMLVIFALLFPSRYWRF